MTAVQLTPSQRAALEAVAETMQQATDALLQIVADLRAKVPEDAECVDGVGTADPIRH